MSFVVQLHIISSGGSVKSQSSSTVGDDQLYKSIQGDGCKLISVERSRANTSLRSKAFDELELLRRVKVASEEEARI